MRKQAKAREFSTAAEVAAVGIPILEEDEFALIRLCHFEWVFVDTAARRNGKMEYGRAEVVKGKTAFLWRKQRGEEGSEPFFLLTFAADLWAKLDGDGRAWLVRHELRHCFVKKGKLAIRPHDFELFFADLDDTSNRVVCAIHKIVQKGSQEVMDLPVGEAA